MKEDLFYIGIRNAGDIRKNLLYSSKDIINSLRSYESFKRAKERKKELLIQFNSLAEELAVLMGRLRSRLPKGSLKAEISRPETIKTPSAQLNVLEEELKKVEERLKELE